MSDDADLSKRDEFDDLVGASKVYFTDLLGQCNTLGNKMGALDAKKEELRCSSLSKMPNSNFPNEKNPKVELNSKLDHGLEVVKFNIGGRYVDIKRTTLTQVPSRLGWMMNGRWDHSFPRDRSGRLFLDLDYEWIGPIFFYLRGLAEQESEPSDEEDTPPVVMSDSTGQVEVFRWLEIESLLVTGSTPSPLSKAVSSPPKKKKRLNDDDVMGVFERAVSVVEKSEKDFSDEVEFMTDLTERLGHEDRRTLLYFNVGGTPFTVSKYTIAQAPASKLWAQYCSGRWEVHTRELDQDGSIFLDMDPGCFGKIISCLRLVALAKDRGCDIQTWSDSVVIEPSQSRCFDRMVAYLQIDDTVFAGILERREDHTAGPLSKTIRRFSKHLTEWVGTPPRTWKLLYRGSRDGFSVGAFHAACNGKGSTIVVMKDTNNSVFGGYSSVSWTYHQYVDSPGAFLFSLSRKGVLDPTAAIKFPLPQPMVDTYSRNGPSWINKQTGQWALQINGMNGASDLSWTMGDPYLLTGGSKFVLGEIEVYTTKGYNGTVVKGGYYGDCGAVFVQNVRDNGDE